MQAPLEFSAAPVWAALAPLLGRALLALAVAFIAWRLATALRGWFERATARSSADVHLRVLAGRFLYLVVFIYGLVWALELLGVSPAALVAGFGVLGLAASLALQDILKSFCAGVYLLFERPFHLGDEIKIKDFRGRVIDIGIRTTVLHTSDNQEVIVPNSVVLADVVVNHARYRTSLVEQSPPQDPTAMMRTDA
ncbi:MAG TPA: mechanosensitive ion channel domain-containing protein [Chloroflexota bacterium]|nr:mechanosensitive ion channel domain-containing protein [Chloroflexota bacterium]